MADQDYPTELTGFERDSLQVNLKISATQESELDGGLQSYLVGTAELYEYRGTVILYDETEYSIWTNFLNNILKFGVLKFDWIHPITRDPIETRIDKQSGIEYGTREAAFTVTFSILIIEVLA